MARWLLSSLKGSQVTVATTGCRPPGPETAREGGKKVKQKRRQYTSRPQLYFLFFVGVFGRPRLASGPG